MATAELSPRVRDRQRFSGPTGRRAAARQDVRATRTNVGPQHRRARPWGCPRQSRVGLGRPGRICSLDQRGVPVHDVPKFAWVEARAAARLEARRSPRRTATARTTKGPRPCPGANAGAARSGEADSRSPSRSARSRRGRGWPDRSTRGPGASRLPRASASSVGGGCRSVPRRSAPGGDHGCASRVRIEAHGEVGTQRIPDRDERRQAGLAVAAFDPKQIAGIDPARSSQGGASDARVSREAEDLRTDRPSEVRDAAVHDLRATHPPN